MKRLVCAMLLLLLSAIPALAKNVYIDGEMNSRIDYEMKRRILSASSASRFILSFVAPKSVQSPTFVQDISNFKLAFSPQPGDRSVMTDSRGNEVMTYTWTNPPQFIDVTVSFTAVNRTTLKKIESGATFPLTDVPADVAVYLKPSDYVQSTDPRIRDLAARLTKGMKSEFDAIRAAITYVVDNMRYVSPPPAYDAIFSLDSGRGNCQNYSHLSAALLRAVGIPTRIVNGMTLDQPYDVNLKGNSFRSKMGLGRHSWIEVWFPDLGWVPFDPQNTVFFVPNRFIKVEVGIDNKETINDGLVQYALNPGSSVRPSVQDSYAPDFRSDVVKLSGQMADAGPRNILMQPSTALGEMVASVLPKPSPTPSLPVYTPTPGLTRPTPAPSVAIASPTPGLSTPGAALPKPSPTPGLSASPTPGIPQVVIPDVPHPVLPIIGSLPPSRPDTGRPIIPSYAVTPTPTPLPQAAEIIRTIDGRKYAFKQPYMYGNTEFPEDIDFTQYNVTSDKGNGMYAITRNFVVETAEYVTTKMTQYAQVFQLDRPLVLSRAGLALHRFGGDGQLWVEIYADNKGMPGAQLYTSEIVDLDRISMKPGYRWVDFAFKPGEVILKPGSYWLALGFTGDPIVNWFYTYGKPVGPFFGTRFKDVFGKEWSGALSYEFNYRVAGLAGLSAEPTPAPAVTPPPKVKGKVKKKG